MQLYPHTKVVTFKGIYIVIIQNVHFLYENAPFGKRKATTSDTIYIKNIKQINVKVN